MENQEKIRSIFPGLRESTYERLCIRNNEIILYNIERTEGVPLTTGLVPSVFYLMDNESNIHIILELLGKGFYKEIDFSPFSDGLIFRYKIDILFDIILYQNFGNDYLTVEEGFHKLKCSILKTHNMIYIKHKLIYELFNFVCLEIDTDVYPDLTMIPCDFALIVPRNDKFPINAYNIVKDKFLVFGYRTDPNELFVICLPDYPVYFGDKKIYTNDIFNKSEVIKIVEQNFRPITRMAKSAK